jgi:hypothetical protein
VKPGESLLLEVGRVHCATQARCPSCPIPSLGFTTPPLSLSPLLPARLHAVLQFRGSDGAAFVLDPGSTHGTHLNKKRLPPGQHVSLRWGAGGCGGVVWRGWGCDGMRWQGRAGGRVAWQPLLASPLEPHSHRIATPHFTPCRPCLFPMQGGRPASVWRELAHLCAVRSS